jgi:hypothetical protein
MIIAVSDFEGIDSKTEYHYIGSETSLTIEGLKYIKFGINGVVTCDRADDVKRIN